MQASVLMSTIISWEESKIRSSFETCRLSNSLGHNFVTRMPIGLFFPEPISSGRLFCHRINFDKTHHRHKKIDVSRQNLRPHVHMHIFIFFSIADLPSQAHSFFFFFVATPDLKSLKIKNPLQFKKSLKVNPRPVCFVVLSQNLFLHNCKRHSIISQQPWRTHTPIPYTNLISRNNTKSSNPKTFRPPYQPLLHHRPTKLAAPKQPNNQTCKIEGTKFVRTCAAGMAFLPC